MRIAIIGSGFAGIGAAIRLLQTGERNFVLLERATDLGGVWRDNVYPGCACDVQSRLYSFSFAPKASWTRSYAPQAEILAYLRDCARDFGVLPYVRFGHEVKTARWNDESKSWRIEMASGDVLSADLLVGAQGALADPSIPRLPGIETFAGLTFHSARWRHDVGLRGRKVGVIGTGASSIQFVPQIQPEVEKLVIFQRTPAWIMPRGDTAISAGTKLLFERVPAAMRAARHALFAARELTLLSFRKGPVNRLAKQLAKRHLDRAVADPLLRDKLTPRYDLGCKRILLSDDYLPAVARPNVTLETTPIREVRAHSIVAGAAEHQLDTIIYGTGFRITDPPVSHLVFGRDGRSLAEHWRGSPQAHRGTMVSGFPNLFLLQGPNTGLGHTSVILMIEAQIEHMLDVLAHLVDRGGRSIEPRPEAQAAFVHEVDQKMRGSVWTQGGCQSWYLDDTGRNSTIWPDFVFEFQRRMARFQPDEYSVWRQSS